MITPDFQAMMRARADFDVQIGKATAFLAPAPGDTKIEASPQMIEFAIARVKIARQALDRFEAAIRGEAR
jgi:hypothetical protein